MGGGNSNGLDPHTNTFNSAGRDIARLFSNGLIKKDLKASSIAPDLATSWQYDSVGTTLTFKIRQGVKFQNITPVNGRNMTAEDVRYSLDRIMNPARDNPKATLRVNFANVKGIEVVDPETVKLTLAGPDAELINYIAHEQTVILAKEAAIDGAYGDVKALIGTGPFIVKALQPSGGGESRYERNTTYFIPDRPYVDVITYLQNDNPAIRNAALRSKQLDWSAVQTPNDVRFFAGTGEVTTSNTEGKLWGTTGMWMNTTIAPFTDIRLRRALNLAIDRTAITDGAFNGAAGATGPLGNSAPGWDLAKVKSLPGYGDKKAEIAQAKAIMKEAGFENGFSFTVHTDPNYYDPPLAVVQAQLKQDANITMNIVRDSSYNYRFATYVKEKNAQAVFMQSLGTSADQPFFLHYRSDGPRNMAQLNDPALNTAIDQQRATLDATARGRMLNDLQQKILDIQPAAYTVYYTWTYIAFNYVKNWFGPSEAFNFSAAQIQDVWLDK